MSKMQEYINYIADPRARRSIRGILSSFMNDDNSMTFKDIVFGNGTTIISLAGTFTTGLSISGAGATGLSITGVCSTAAIQLGTSGVPVGDFLAYGATAGCSLLWDSSADELIITKTSAIATATNLKSMTVSQTLTGASSVNTAEVSRSILTSNVQVGNWANAILGKVDFSTSGFVTGTAGVICAELDMPEATIGNGSYMCFEAELNVPTGADGWGTTVPVAFIGGNAWGAGIAEFQAEGYIFNFTGLGSVGASNIIQANTDQATHGLRILVDGVEYFMLMTTVDNGTE